MISISFVYSNAGFIGSVEQTWVFDGYLEVICPLQLLISVHNVDCCVLL